uniref:Uncharacterized protein n=1 Tax=Timema bartmani TaxID=61472 RepID=A0A7R9ENN9_9NEOP|nr:unnamed protein product [Timema bartmani]
MNLPLVLEPNWEQYEWIQNSYSPVERFEMFLDDEVIKLIANCSSNYVFQKGNIKFKVTVDFVKVVGIFFCGGGHITVVVVLNNTSLVSQSILVTKCGVFVFHLVIYSSSRGAISRSKLRDSYSQLTDTNNGITLIRFNDNNSVTVASYLQGAIRKARRWNHK